VAALASPNVDAQVAIRCQVCATKIVMPGPDEIVVKNAILRVDSASGRVTAKCPRCKAWVEIPFRYFG
jgi:phage FluMu protein Com